MGDYPECRDGRLTAVRHCYGWVSVWIAVSLAFLSAAAGGAKGRRWLEGKMVAVQRAESARPETNDPFLTSSSQAPFPRYSETRGGNSWIIVIETPEGPYAAGGQAPGRKSYLSRLEAGSTVRLAADGRNLYILEREGKEHKLRLLEKPGVSGLKK